MTTNNNAFFIGGEWHAPTSSGVITVVSPNDEQVVGHAPDGVEATWMPPSAPHAAHSTTRPDGRSGSRRGEHRRWGAWPMRWTSAQPKWSRR